MKFVEYQKEWVMKTVSGIKYSVMSTEGVKVKLTVMSIYGKIEQGPGIVEKDSEDYKIAKLFSELDGINKIVFGCYNMPMFSEFVKIEEDKRVFKETEEMKTKIQLLISGHKRYGDQNYGLELFANKGDEQPVLRITRPVSHLYF